MSYLYKTMRHNTIDVTWEDDSFASGWVASYCGLIQDGDIAELTVNVGNSGGWIQKDGLNINAEIYKYLVTCLKGDDHFFIEVYDGSWKSATSGHQDAPSDYDFKVYDLSGITTGTITSIRLGVGDAELKKAYYDFVSFHGYRPAFAADKIISIVTRHNETDLDEFEIIGTEDVGGGLSDIGCHIRILLNGMGGGRKVFAGVIEEATPEDLNGRVLRVTGRCFGQKLLLRTKTKDFNNREVSLAVKDFVQDLTEISTLQVETPSPAAYITKDYQSEHIMDGLKDLAKQAGSDWEVKLGMGHDLRFRSRASANVPSLPYQINESQGHILRGVRKGLDGYRAYNKVSVLGGERSNIDGDPDKYTDLGDVSAWTWQAFNGGVVEETAEDLYCGQRGINIYYNSYVNTMEVEFTLGSQGIDVTLFGYSRFMHKGDTLPASGVYGIQGYPDGTTWYFQLRLIDWNAKNATITYLPSSTQPPRAFAEIILDFDDFSVESGFNWAHVKYVQFRVISNRSSPGEGVRGRFQVDKFRFYAQTIKKSASTTTDFKHIREYIYRDEKLVDPTYIQEVANALLNFAKNKENRYKVPVIGMPFVQVGHKANVISPTHDLNGTYYIVEAEHKVTPRQGYVTEMTLEKPRLSLERLLAEAIERKIKLIERGGIA